MNEWMVKHAADHSLKLIWDKDVQRFIVKIEGPEAPPIAGIGYTVLGAVESLVREFVQYGSIREKEVGSADRSQESLDK